MSVDKKKEDILKEVYEMFHWVDGIHQPEHEGIEDVLRFVMDKSYSLGKRNKE